MTGNDFDMPLTSSGGISVLMLNVYRGFLKHFPDSKDDVEKIFRINEKDALRIVMKNHQEFIFKYSGEDDYLLATRKAYEKMKLPK